MKENIFVMGWVDPYSTKFERTEYNEARKSALITRVEKRRYFFTFFDHEMMGIVPLYSDNKYCMLTKSELDEVFKEAYKDTNIESRKLPEDEEETVWYNGTLYEKKKFIKEDNN